MTTARKTATQIKDMIITQLETSLNTTIPLLPKSFNRVIAKALGGIFVLLYQFAGWILLQMFVKTASNKPVTVNGVTITPLKMWGEQAPGGPITQNDGQRAERDIEITVITQTGSLTSGMRVINTATEMIYTLVGDVPLDAATKTATIRATKAGDLGNVDPGETLSFMSPPSTVQKKVTVVTSIPDLSVLGVDPEETEDYRRRVSNRYAARPQGGAYADYRDWAEAVAGVKNAYPYSGWSFATSWPSGGPGWVFVFIESTSDPDGIPPDPGSLLTAVAAAIENEISGLASRRNINAKVDVKPISRTAFDVTMATPGYAEDVGDVKDAIEEALEEYFLDRGPYIFGLHRPPRKDFITKAEVGGVVGLVAQALGATVTSITISVGGTDHRFYPLQEGEKAKLGSVTWQ